MDNHKIHYNRKWFFCGMGLVLLILVGYLLPVPASLEAAAVAAGSDGRMAMKTLAITALAVSWWVGDVYPDWLTTVAMMLLWILIGKMSFSAAFASFTSTSVWIIVGSFCLATAINKTGFFRRVSWFLLQIFPPTFHGQVLSMLLVGAVCSPLVPSATAKVLLGVTIAGGVSSAMNYGPESKGRYGLFFAAWAGYGLSAPAFVSASIYGYTLMGTLPENSGITWGVWCISMLPWLVLMLLGIFCAISLMYKPEQDIAISKEYVKGQLKSMGKLQGKELLSAGILFVTVVLWVLEAQVGIDASVTAMIAAFFCFAFGILEYKEISTAPNWNLAIFLGGVLSLGSVFARVGIDIWLQGILKPVFEQIANPVIICVIIAVVTVLVRFMLAAQSAAIIVMMAILSPVASTLGLSPFVIGIIVYTAGMCWFVPYQNVAYMTGFSCTEGKLTYGKTVKFCGVYEIISLIACLLSLPYWKMIGIM